MYSAWFRNWAAVVAEMIGVFLVRCFGGEVRYPYSVL
jgi:hypothetical protein